MAIKTATSDSDLFAEARTPHTLALQQPSANRTKRRHYLFPSRLFSVSLAPID